MPVPFSLLKLQCFAGSDYDVLKTLSLGGVGVAALLLHDDLGEEPLDAGTDLDWLTVPAVLCLKRTAAITVRYALATFILAVVVSL
jgi:hypothetical protein